MNFEYRQGHIKDKDKLKELALISYGQFEKVLIEEDWNLLYENLNSESTYIELLKISTCFICEYDSKIVGVAYFVPSGNPTEIFDSKWSYLRMVGVDPKYRGKGISKKLTQKCIDHATTAGEIVVALHTSEFMDAARHIYESLGFIKTKELKLLFGKRYWLYKLKIN